ncbi:hypothetical protein V5R04_06675 [Jonesiaceae bacterium BS-20]|uniref:Prepilin-type N-terminal cleavage/methylation domain-containing protein n=1 Tax=Jonesiaceae bacterium BS-20 TaxID=3120821 RepID=A0AAU7E0M8_9MICO
MNRFQAAQTRDTGYTLVETLSAIFLVTLVSISTASSGIQQARITGYTQHLSVAQGHATKIISDGRKANFEDLGFYQSDPGAPTGTVNLPLTTVDGPPEPVKEDAVVLGAQRPTTASTFTAGPHETFKSGGHIFKAATYVTEVNPQPGADRSRGKRITVVMQWAPENQEETLTGQCTLDSRNCAVESIVRTASGSDIDPISGDYASSTSTCTLAAAAVCESYVRSGRVLDGATMASAYSSPVQNDDVDLHARVTQPARAMTATWTHQVPTPKGIQAKTVTKELSSTDGGTRWSVTVPADNLTDLNNGAGPKGEIRAGDVKVTFTAQFDNAPAHTRSTDSFWAYQMSTGDTVDHVDASLSPESATATTWCSPITPQPLTFEVTGHSVGLKTTNSPTSAADRVYVVFTTKNGTTTSTTKVEASIIEARDVTRNISGTLVTISANADWKVTPPPTANCDVTSTAVVIVERAVDRSTTTLPLTLTVA